MKLSNVVKSALPVAVFGVLALASTSAMATTVSVPTTFQVTATVQATCLISAGTLGFGTYTGLLANSTSNITVTCTNTTPYNVGLSQGNWTGATVSDRRMTGPGTDVLKYTLTSLSYTGTNWGNTAGTDTVSGTGSGAVQTLTVFGSVAASQYVVPGAYSDTITATITY